MARRMQYLDDATSVTIEASMHLDSLSSIAVALLRYLLKHGVDDGEEIHTSLHVDAIQYSIELSSNASVALDDIVSAGPLDYVAALSRLTISSTLLSAEGITTISREYDTNKVTITPATKCKKGLVIRATNIFHCFYARRMSTIDTRELSLIRSAAQQLLMIYYWVSLRVTSPGDRGSFEIPSHDSLLDRLAYYHGDIANTVPTSIRREEYIIEGCIIPYSTAAAFQYAYINKNFDATLCALVDAAYKAATGASGSAAVSTRRHHEASLATDPSFVFAITTRAESQLTFQLGSDERIETYKALILAFTRAKKEQTKQAREAPFMSYFIASTPTAGTESCFPLLDLLQPSMPEQPSPEPTVVTYKSSLTFSLKRPSYATALVDHFDALCQDDEADIDIDPASIPTHEPISAPAPCPEHTLEMAPPPEELGMSAVKSSRHLQHDDNADFTSTRVHIKPAATSERTVTAVPEKLHKSQMQSCTAIGQCDKKFIFAQVRNADNVSLLCFDQHAVDERIKLEALGEPAISLIDGYNSPNLTTPASATDKITLEEHRAIFLSWGFKWDATPGASTITVTRVPSIAKEPLTASDFSEFIGFVRANSFLPLSLQRPPAVARILASRACRSAIKFGDSLDKGDCDSLLVQLAETKFSFQCAHGRPSVAPLLSLKNVHEARRLRSNKEVGSLI